MIYFDKRKCNVFSYSFLAAVDTVHCKLMPQNLHSYAKMKLFESVDSL